jgi:uncharacterized FAD-dependent dehydrogenase
MIKQIVIIGAGPSGLCFANQLCSKKNYNFLMIDAGKRLKYRNHDNSEDIACGEGGNGLYSDGKFSFFPAGTGIWSKSYEQIKASYLGIRELLTKYNSEIPKLPSEKQILDYNFKLSKDKWNLKSYPNFYLSLDDRKSLIKDISKKIPNECKKFQHVVIDIEKKDQKYFVVMKNLENSEICQVCADKIVIAGGRFFPLNFVNNFSITIPLKFKRFEIGFRIESNADNNDMLGKGKIRKLLDPKLRKKISNDVEFRTFCWCRKGETVVTSSIEGINTVSGRSDCKPTNRSNFGFLLRVTNPNFMDQELFKKILKIKPFNSKLETILSTDFLEKIFGEKTGQILQIGLVDLLQVLRDINVIGTNIIGPCVEGIGWYPDIDKNFKVPGENLYFIGDNSGIYRGIVPCMLSGYYLSNILNE